MTSRTSVERFRDPSQHGGIREIAKVLGVRNILEGGVQRAGDRIRINVQLIDVSNDDHLWAETYDRDLGDVMALLEEKGIRVHISYVGNYFTSLEMAGAVCHELNQPIQGISSYAESLAEQLTPGCAEHGQVRGILDLTGRMGVITKKLMHITRYETKDYLKGVRIIDIDRAADEPPEPQG